jgi:CDGSH iron-sulfur domain-containing protein 3
MAEPTAAGRAPMGVEVEAGQEYWWCSCGLSKAQPFCDGSHKGSGLKPLGWTAAESGTAWFCTCKKTAAGPLCDGSHKQLPR